jgi:hypothetical protein
MTATANEEDYRRAREYIADCCAVQEDTLAHDIDRLAAQFAAVRAPLEARIAELEAELALVKAAHLAEPGHAASTGAKTAG